MEKPILKDANPYIKISKTPINGSNLYQCFICDKNMKLICTVLFNDQAERTFNVAKFNQIYLAIDNDDFSTEGDLSINPEIVNRLFKESLAPYGIKINKVIMHGYNDLESNDYTFEDEEKKKLLLDIIDYTFKNNL